jgi:hypothetical protein
MMMFLDTADTAAAMIHWLSDDTAELVLLAETDVRTMVLFLADIAVGMFLADTAVGMMLLTLAVANTDTTKLTPVLLVLDTAMMMFPANLVSSVRSMLQRTISMKSLSFCLNAPALVL